MLTLDLAASLKHRLSAGHPWVYRNHLVRVPDLASGTWVQVECGGFRAYGLWDAEGAIAVRLFSRHGVPDRDWVAERVAEAWLGRAPIRSASTTAYRWVYGESDGLPGMIVDLYGEYAVVQTHTSSVEGLLAWVSDALHAHAPLLGLVVRRQGEGPELAWGRPPPRDLTVEEHGLLFRADLMAGQKTGLYLDQRENRHSLASLCQRKSVLDCFCYTGGFSLYALRSGALSITACDAAPQAIQAAQANFALNGFDPGHHSFRTEDGFALLATLARQDQHFGVVVLDPPSFARDKQSRHTAERAYVRLNRLALLCVEPGGLLATSSCTSQVSAEAFRQALAEAARQAGRKLVILHEAGQALDHPVPAHFPEARYLKFVIGRVLTPL